jgi:adenylate cyclase
MSAPRAPVRDSEEFWRDLLTNGDARERQLRRIFKHRPHGPRCQMCATPFEGIGAPFMRLIGKRPSERSPRLCGTCFDLMARHHGGAEVDVSCLFADVRGSTHLAERMSNAAFRDLLDRFYSTATAVVFANDGLVDKFVGDELVAMFFPLLSGERHAERAIDAARSLLRATGHQDPDGPWVPVGAGVHTGRAWVGAVGEGAHVEVTALGDAVNTTARLASVARAGEVLVTTPAAEAAGLDPSLERRTLELKGKELPTEVMVLRG